MNWKRIGRGNYETSDGTLYVSRTRYGWEYGTIDAEGRARIDETTRPLARAKQLAERAEAAV